MHIVAAALPPFSPVSETESRQRTHTFKQVHNSRRLLMAGQNKQIDLETKMNASSTMECPATIGTEIQECMEEFLKSRMLTGSHVVQCEFKEGMLLIRGQVGSFYAKQLTQEYARQIPGVEQVANHLTVVRANQVA